MHLRRENLIPLGREEVLTLTEICQQRMHGYLLIFVVFDDFQFVFDDFHWFVL